MTFQSLSDLLQQSVTPHVASVQAKECGGRRVRVLLYIVPLLQFQLSRVYTVCLLYRFSIEAFDEEGLGEVDGHCCGC